MVFLQLVLIIAVSLSLGTAFGLMVLENHWLPQWIGGVAGGVMGVALALAATGELDPFLVPSDEPTHPPG
jgi:hypothetical protein